MNLLFYIFVIAGTIVIVLNDMLPLGSLNVSKCENASIQDEKRVYNDIQQPCSANNTNPCKDYCGICKIIEISKIIKDGCQHNNTFLLEFLHCIVNEIYDLKDEFLIRLLNNSIRIIIECVTLHEKTFHENSPFDCNVFEDILQINFTKNKSSSYTQHMLDDIASVVLFSQTVENITCSSKH